MKQVKKYKALVPELQQAFLKGMNGGKGSKADVLKLKWQTIPELEKLIIVVWEPTLWY